MLQEENYRWSDDATRLLKTQDIKFVCRIFNNCFVSNNAPTQSPSIRYWCLAHAMSGCHSPLSPLLKSLSLTRWYWDLLFHVTVSLTASLSLRQLCHGSFSGNTVPTTSFSFTSSALSCVFVSLREMEAPRHDHLSHVNPMILSWLRTTWLIHY